MLQETLWLYSEHQEQLGATGIQIQYIHKNYAKKCFSNFDAYTFHIEVYSYQLPV